MTQSSLITIHPVPIPSSSPSHYLPPNMEPTLKLNLRFAYSDYPRSSTPTIEASKKKPKVLLLGKISAEDHVVAELKELAEVYNLPPQSPEEAKKSIEKIARDGPFQAVAVSSCSFSFLPYLTDRSLCLAEMLFHGGTAPNSWGR
jgi:hypothetical protein